MSQEIGLFEAIYSQRAIRYFKPDPVPDELIHKLIEAATKAPSGGNSQPWRFLVIRDSETKRRLQEYYFKAWESAYGTRNQPTGSLETRVRSSAQHLAEHLHEAPVLIMACLQHNGTPSTMARGGSIFPAVQNLLLAARGLGLGSALTSLHRRYEDEIKAMLDIPENVETAALLPIGYPGEGARYGSTRRQPVEDITFSEKWGTSF